MLTMCLYLLWIAVFLKMVFLMFFSVAIIILVL